MDNFIGRVIVRPWKIGNSVVVTIPSRLVEDFDIDEDLEITISKVER